ncbi:nucleotidyltransferase family protein [Chromohalobacter sp. TMW 2.2308]|uniref:nucleotidyltransferase family protein n=1 Tax=Chromohalobacter TaxID=42054 RepID=UPI001FFCE432|nr:MULTISPECIES: nucleotidyltransferase family protein [Chromohalobacter]MCK2042452.1 nucleotidyltransferase family protein [Chromohalobacter moromii]MCK2045590.1 nucleotidyltransferase family protein [Chromohalobacter moromii]MCT8468337.1 nucleotidyltransferase family protein [Chromohalobacter canadensis]MCT8471392.1 nucleotidyltransferase family protein [Chromohalobacter canadensis]MCT8498845.1 nucleotidyltransferase family protein [Chromohalobacter canadensis]
MDYEAQIKKWIEQDAERMEALSIAADLCLPDWCLAAGFVRNLAWDKVHGFSAATALNDIDLVYFDPKDINEARDRRIEAKLRSSSDFPWSVKNQARMHERNVDDPYTSTTNAMSYWVEVETAVGATLDASREVVLVAPFGVEPLFNFTITLNPNRPKPVDFRKRVAGKRWQEIWPKLTVVNA